MWDQKKKKFRKTKGNFFRNVAAPSPQGNNRLKASTNVEEEEIMGKYSLIFVKIYEKRMNNQMKGQNINSIF